MKRGIEGGAGVAIEPLEGRLCPSASVHISALPLPKIARHGVVGGVTVGQHGEVYYTVGVPYDGASALERAYVVRVSGGKAKAFDIGSSLADDLGGLGQTADGRVWFVSRRLADVEDNGATYVGWLDPKTGRTPSQIPAQIVGRGDGGVQDVVPTPDGRLLFLTFGGIDVLSDQGINGTDATFAAEPDGTASTGMTLGPGGYLWVCESGPTNASGLSVGQVSRVSARGRRTVVADTLTAAPDQIVTGADGALWFTESENVDPGDESGGKIGRLDLKGHVTEFPIPSGAVASGIALGPDGNVWFTEPDANAVGSIRPSGFVRERALPRGFKHPTQLTTGPDGRMYFVSDDAVGQIRVKAKRAATASRSVVAAATPVASPFGTGMSTKKEAELWDEGEAPGSRSGEPGHPASHCSKVTWRATGRAK